MGMVIIYFCVKCKEQGSVFRLGGRFRLCISKFGGFSYTQWCELDQIFKVRHP